MGFREIKAQDGCIIFFPSRQDLKKLPSIISGPQKTRRRWGEEWVQLKTDLVTLDDRLEGDKAVDLGNDLRCDVVARIITQLDDTDLKSSLPKLVEHLRCSTTQNSQTVLTSMFFHDRLEPKFRVAVENVVSEANYLRLLEDPNHRGELQQSFAKLAKTFLLECGFSLVSSEIRFRPLDPGILGGEEMITEKWIEQERARASLEEKKKRMLEEIEDESKRSASQRALDTERELKRIEVEKKRAEKEYGQQLHEIEQEIAEQKNAKERALAEARRELDEYFRQRQLEKEKQEQEGKTQEIRNQQALQQIKDQQLRDHDKDRMQHEAYMRQENLTALKQETEIADNQFEIAELEAEQKKVRGMADAQVTEARVKAEEAVQKDQASAVVGMLEKLIENLPAIVSKMPVNTSTDRTVVQIGTDVDSNLLGGGTGLLGLLLVPTVQAFLGNLSEYTSRALANSSSADLVKNLEKEKLEQNNRATFDSEPVSRSGDDQESG